MDQSRIYLCSRSPRRRELLKQVGVNFSMLLLRSGNAQRSADVDETPLPNETPQAYVLRISQEKARAGCAALRFRSLPVLPVLAADTTVTLDNKIFGKPENAEHAAVMLGELSGREHQVLSAVAVAMGEQVEVLLSTSIVRFAKLDDERIKRYVLTHEYTDKAGGYGIQGYAGAFVEHLSGSYSGVMGLPLFETVELLKRFDYPVP
ncbi:MAG: Maf family protein [Pseudomonadota bacterium]